MHRFFNKVAVVTGAGSGVGRELALQLADAGAELALSDSDETALAETMRRMPPDAWARAYRLDVTDQAAVFHHAALVRRDFGTAHFIFSSAGAALSPPVDDAAGAALECQADLNLRGVIHATRAFLPLLLQQRDGHLVHISGSLTTLARPHEHGYRLPCFGVRGWTACLGQELRGTGVRATCVHARWRQTGAAREARLPRTTAGCRRWPVSSWRAWRRAGGA